MKRELPQIWPIGIAVGLILGLAIGWGHCQDLPDKPIPARKRDLSSLLLVLPLAASQIADISTSEAAFKRGAHENNPFYRIPFGRHPSAGQFALGMVPENFGVAYLGHRMRGSRHHVVRELWWLPQVATIGVHTRDAVHNLSQGGKRR